MPASIKDYKQALSPLLSNIVLDELDKELEKRGHCFVRYAADCSIYVRSEKAAHRVCASITKYIEKELRLKVNRTKTKVSRPKESTLVGFSFYEKEGKWEIKIAKHSIKRITAKCKGISKNSIFRDIIFYNILIISIYFMKKIS